MCLKVWVSVAFYFACLLTLSDGFFLPVFVRKQHPQTPALNSPQWTSYQSTGSVPPLTSSAGNGNVNINSIGSNASPGQQQPPQQQQLSSSNTYKEYNPFQQAQGVVTPLHQVQISPLHTPYGYETGNPGYQVGPYPQYQSAFHSVQLVPCLCPISKDVIEQQTQPFQHLQPIQSSSSSSPSSPSSSSSIESGSNDVHMKGSQKIGS